MFTRSLVGSQPEMPHNGRFDRHITRGHLHVKARGSLTAANGHLLRTLLSIGPDEDVDRITIDLRTLDRLDLAGLCAVTAPTLTHRRAGRHTTIHAPDNDTPRRLCDLTGVLQTLARREAPDSP
jgi:anti-anti-sigma regulatory factor